MFLLEHEEKYTHIICGVGEIELEEMIQQISEEPQMDIIVSEIGQFNNQVEDVLKAMKEANPSIIIVDDPYHSAYSSIYDELGINAIPTLSEATDYLFMIQLERELGEGL